MLNKSIIMLQIQTNIKLNIIRYGFAARNVSIYVYSSCFLIILCAQFIFCVLGDGFQYGNRGGEPPKQEIVNITYIS